MSPAPTIALKLCTETATATFAVNTLQPHPASVDARGQRTSWILNRAVGQLLPIFAKGVVLLTMATTTMNISLPDVLRDFVEEEVTERGYSSASEYLRELVRERKAKKELEVKLLEGIDSELSDENLDDFLATLRERVSAAARKKRS